MKKYTISVIILLACIAPVHAQEALTFECDGFTLSMIPDSLNSVEIKGYAGEETELTIPESFRLEGNLYSVSSIGSQAFYYNQNIKEIILPDGLSHIGEMAFTGCHNLDVIVLPRTLVSVDPFAFTETGLTTVVVPDGVDALPFDAFLNSEKLRTLVLGRGVVDIHYAALGKLPSLKELYVLSPNIPGIRKGTLPFIDADCSDATVYVPSGLQSQYPSRPENSRDVRNPMTHDFEDGWWYFHDYRTVPDLFTVLYKDNYSVETGESAQVLYETINYGDVNVYGMEWVCDDTDVATVQDGYITGNGSGVTKGRVKVMTSEGMFISPDFDIEVTASEINENPHNVPAGKHVSGISLICEGEGTAEIYSLDGMYLGNETENLTPGIYIMRNNGENRKITVK